MSLGLDSKPKSRRMFKRKDDSDEEDADDKHTTSNMRDASSKNGKGFNSLTDFLNDIDENSINDMSSKRSRPLKRKRNNNFNDADSIDSDKTPKKKGNKN